MKSIWTNRCLFRIPRGIPVYYRYRLVRVIGACQMDLQTVLGNVAGIYIYVCSTSVYPNSNLRNPLVGSRAKYWTFKFVKTNIGTTRKCFG